MYTQYYFKKQNKLQRISSFHLVSISIHSGFLVQILVEIFRDYFICSILGKKKLCQLYYPFLLLTNFMWQNRLSQSYCFLWLKQHLKELNDPEREGILKHTEHMLSQGIMDLPLTLCFAARRGDDLLLHQLLKLVCSFNSCRVIQMNLTNMDELRWCENIISYILHKTCMDSECTAHYGFKW